ncbi:MAG: DUF1828 domain-containing protein [Bryobacterales bacterium]|nr:DUF1828 domain-containing protein [Bryobacterales bacterium]
MAINADDLRRRLCDQLCAEVRVKQRPDGEFMLESDFEFPDGDRYPIYLSESLGGVRLSDKGDTVMRISYDHDIDAFLAGSRGLLVERIAFEERVSWKRGVLFVDTPIDRLSESLFRYGQALTRIYALTLRSRSRAASTFYEDLADLICQSTDAEQIQRDYILPDIPNSEAYPVDYRFQGKSSEHLFLYGVPNRDKARLTTVFLSHFHRFGLDFDSIIIFKNQAEIPRMDLARLSDVGGEMISSLGSGKDLHRKMKRRVA